MSEPKKVKFKFNGREIEAAEGSLAIDAARAHGIDVPHYCYHPALGNPGNCRLCVVEVAGAPKPMVSCRLPVKEGMDIKSDSDVAKRAQASSVELHLVNHPLDCPVCDQSGECGLQDYYMKFGRYESQVREDKLHKGKRIEAGPHVMLDQERCVLCTRCTRFTEKITKTHELGIFGRGHTERVDLTPGMTLDNAYSGNVVDICPVGALTDKDFRYKVRVWYLDMADSICPGCSRGCNISVHTNTKRPWHNDGKRVARLKPRQNDEVNGYWMCDDGRYGWDHLENDRLGRIMRLIPERKELSWESALDELTPHLWAHAKKMAVVCDGRLSNEDWAGLDRLFFQALGVDKFLFSPEPDQLGVEDDLLRRKEKVPNLKGGEAAGFLKSMSWDHLADAIDNGHVDSLYIIERDAAKVWGAKAKALFGKLAFSVFQGPNKGETGDLVKYRLPATAYVEEAGHFTNFEGRIQKYEQALEPIGQALPDWRIFEALHERVATKETSAA